MESLRDLRDMLQSCCSWHHRNPKLPTSPNDRAVLRLVYNAGHETELGLVCERADGTYWCFTTSSLISCLPLAIHLDIYPTKELAADVLLSHVLDELVRVSQLNSDTYHSMPAFKKRDRLACASYKAKPEDFKAGASWILQSEGFPRRPSWAKFLVQNGDGKFMWFEEKPELLSGSWHCVSGRSQTVCLAERLTSRIVRLL